MLRNGVATHTQKYTQNGKLQRVASRKSQTDAHTARLENNSADVREQTQPLSGLRKSGSHLIHGDEVKGPKQRETKSPFPHFNLVIVATFFTFQNLNKMLQH